VKKIFYISLFLFIASNSALTQQEPLFSSFAFNKLPYNPGVAGSVDRASILLTYRNQWAGLPGAPKTQLLSYNSGSSKLRHGWAVQAKANSIGIQTRYDLSAFYSYGITFNDNSLRIGTQFSNRRYSNDYTSPDILALDGFIPDPALDRSVISSSTYNLAVGLFYKRDNLFAGVSVSNILNNSIQSGNPYINSTESKHLYAMFGADVTLNQDWTYHPQFLYKISENTPYNLDFLSMFSYQNSLFLGLNIRSGGSQNAMLESFDYILGFQITDNVFGAVSYDLSVSELKEVENGSLELMLKYNFYKNLKKDSLFDFGEQQLAFLSTIDTASHPVGEETNIVEINKSDKKLLDTLGSIDKLRLMSGKSLVFNNIHYDFNSFTILEGAAIDLNALSAFLLSNPKIQIQLSSFTDSRGNDSFNLELSSKRALSAKEYLIQKGVNPKNIIAIGLGETNILNHCINGIECTEEEHNFNRRTEVKLIKN